MSFELPIGVIMHTLRGELVHWLDSPEAVIGVLKRSKVGLFLVLDVAHLLDGTQ